jgi:hypothetical protein
MSHHDRKSINGAFSKFEANNPSKLRVELIEYEPIPQITIVFTLVFFN